MTDAEERVSSEVLCEAAGVSIATLQRWVSLGLLPRCVRVNAGDGPKGMYPRDALERVRAITALRGKGYSLAEIATHFGESKPAPRKRRKR